METPVLVSSTVAQGNDHRLKINISSVDEEQLYICSLVTSGPCFTTSKALRRSKNIAPVYKPWSIASSRSSFFFVRFIGTDPNAPHYHRNHLCHYILQFSNFFRKILIFLNNFSSFFLTRPFSGIATSIIWQLFSLLLTISKSELLALSSWSVRVLKSHKKL